jgi:hypothetical protein
MLELGTKSDDSAALFESSSVWSYFASRGNGTLAATLTPVIRYDITLAAARLPQSEYLVGFRTFLVKGTLFALSFQCSL